jgi:hypothetical protein
MPVRHGAADRLPSIAILLHDREIVAGAWLYGASLAEAGDECVDLRKQRTGCCFHSAVAFADAVCSNTEPGNLHC